MWRSKKQKSKWLIPLFIVSEIITSANISAENPPQSVLINGVRWATCNVAAPGTFTAKPEEAGMFYQWNKKTEVVSAGGSVLGGSTFHSWAKANDPSPAGWRVPTFDEIETLCDKNKVNSEWTTVNGVAFI